MPRDVPGSIVMAFGAEDHVGEWAAKKRKTGDRRIERTMSMLTLLAPRTTETPGSLARLLTLCPPFLSPQRLVARTGGASF